MQQVINMKVKCSSYLHKNGIINRTIEVSTEERIYHQKNKRSKECAVCQL